MVSIVDEKRINLSLSKYKLSDGNVVDTTWVKQNIRYIDNVKIYQNGKIAWVSLPLVLRRISFMPVCAIFIID